MSKFPISHIPKGVKNCNDKCLVQEKRPSMYSPTREVGVVDPMLRRGQIYDKTAKVTDKEQSSHPLMSFFGRR